MKERKVYEKHSECVWAKIIEQELILSVCLKSVCIDNNEECVIRGGEGEELVSQ